MRDLIDDRAELDDEEEDGSFAEGDEDGEEEAPRRRERRAELDDSSEEDDEDEDEEEARKVRSHRMGRSFQRKCTTGLPTDVHRFAKVSSSMRMKKTKMATPMSENGGDVENVGVPNATKRRSSMRKIWI